MNFGYDSPLKTLHIGHGFGFNGVSFLAAEMAASRGCLLCQLAPQCV